MKLPALLIVTLFTSLTTLQQSKAANTDPMHNPLEKPADSTKKSNRLKLKPNQFYQIGIAESFIGGLFEATYPVGDLLQHGNFGVGAPGLLDGEFTFYNGQAYQTQSSGKTTLVKDTAKTALSFVTFFKADTTFIINDVSSPKEAFSKIQEHLKHKNAIYAIKISGTFNYVKTRAFPKRTQKPFPPLATLLDQQHFFDIRNTPGVLVGFNLPAYLNGLSIEGFHFHFLSDDKTKGGHMLDFSSSALKVEIAEQTDFQLKIPQDSAFREYDFKKQHNADLDKVEKGH